MGTVVPATSDDDDSGSSEATSSDVNNNSADIISHIKTMKSSSSDSASDSATDQATALEVSTETSQSITYTDGSTTETYFKYQRKSSGTTASDSDGEDDTGNIIGGDYSAPPGADISLSAFAEATENVVRFVAYAFSLVSAFILIGLHVLALNSPDWLVHSGGSGVLSYWFMPNTWELVGVFFYFQQLGSISMLELTKAPYLVLDFTDSFSYFNFYFTSEAVSGARNLSFVILTGIVAYADRIGVDESKILMSTAYFFVGLVCVLLGLFVASALIYRYLERNRFDETVGDQERESPRVLRRNYSICILGLGVAMWLISMFPIMTMATYEMVMEAKYGVTDNMLVVAFLVIVVVVGGLCFFFYRVRVVPATDSFDCTNFALYGTLYADTKSGMRCFFVVTVLYQVITGVITGGEQDTPQQLVGLFTFHALYTAALVYFKPFADIRPRFFLVTFCIFTLINLALSIAFLTSNTLSTSERATVAHAFVVINFIIVLLLFIRHVVMVILTRRLWKKNSRQSITWSDETPLSMNMHAANSRLETSTAGVPSFSHAHHTVQMVQYQQNAEIERFSRKLTTQR